MSSELVDPSMQMGKSKNRSLKCALVHFTKYLAYVRHSKLSFDALEESDITRDLIGKFTCYLMQHVPSIKKYSTSDNYLSAIHVALEMKYPAKMASLTKAYKALRDSMFAKYRKDSVESGVKFVEGAPIMTSRDLSYICRRCLADKNYELRCFFLMDKFGVGRCTEGTTLLWSNFKEYSEDDEDAQCPCIEWFRSKTGTMDDLCLMPDPRCFETCVIHAIASHACLAINPGPNIFTYRYLSETGNHVINMCCEMTVTI